MRSHFDSTCEGDQARNPDGEPHTLQWVCDVPRPESDPLDQVAFLAIATRPPRV